MRLKPKVYFNYDVELVPESLGKTPCFEDTMVTEEKNYDTKSGRIIKGLVISSFDVRDNFAGYKVSDFFMQNLIETGAIENMKAVSFSDGDIDLALNAMDAIANAPVEE